MTTEERMNIIKAKAKAIANAELDAKAREDAERQELVDKVREMFERIQDVLTLANACRAIGLKMPKDGKRYGYEYSFETEGIDHHVGLVMSKDPYEFIGIRNGGFCGVMDFWTNGNVCYSVHEENRSIRRAPRINDLKKFLEEFPVFEAAFLKWIDGMEV